MKFISIIAFLQLSFAHAGNNAPGPLRVWYGESTIATVSSRSGIWNGNYKVENMFDENADTCWHSEKRFELIAKTMRVDFKVNRTCVRHIC